MKRIVLALAFILAPVLGWSATYTELHNLAKDALLLNKIEMAVAEAARIVQAGEDTGAPFDQVAPQPANRRAWAACISANPRAAAEKVIYFVLMENKAASTAVILAATDATVQTNVNEVVDLFATGEGC